MIQQLYLQKFSTGSNQGFTKTTLSTRFLLDHIIKKTKEQNKYSTTENRLNVMWNTMQPFFISWSWGYSSIKSGDFVSSLHINFSYRSCRERQGLKLGRWKRFSYLYIWILFFEITFLHMCICVLTLSTIRTFSKRTILPSMLCNEHLLRLEHKYQTLLYLYQKELIKWTPFTEILKIK